MVVLWLANMRMIYTYVQASKNSRTPVTGPGAVLQFAPKLSLRDLVCILFSNTFKGTATRTAARTLLNTLYYPLQGAHTAACNLK